MNKSNNKGCFSGVLGTLLVALGVVIYALISSQVSKMLVRSRFGGDAACALLTLTLVGYGVAFVLYEVVFVIWQFKLSAEASGRGDTAGKLKQVLRISFAVAICLSLLFSVVVGSTFVSCREDSISKVCFVETREYRWDTRGDVLRYTFACDEGGGLTFTVTMKDGEKVEILGGVSSLTEAFKEEYRTSEFGMRAYAAHLSEQFDGSEYIIEKKLVGVELMEKYYSKDYPTIWEQITRIIGTQAQ